MNKDVKAVTKKQLNSIQIVEALMKKRWYLYDMMKERLVCEVNTENEHAYKIDNEIAKTNFPKRSQQTTSGETIRWKTSDH